MISSSICKGDLCLEFCSRLAAAQDSDGVRTRSMSARASSSGGGRDSGSGCGGISFGGGKGAGDRRFDAGEAAEPDTVRALEAEGLQHSLEAQTVGKHRGGLYSGF